MAAICYWRLFNDNEKEISMDKVRKEESVLDYMEKEDKEALTKELQEMEQRILKVRPDITLEYLEALSEYVNRRLAYNLGCHLHYHCFSESDND